MNEAFRLVDTAAFDARGGYVRWVVPGLDVDFPPHPQASADLWTDAAGRLKVRFSCVKFVCHFQVIGANGAAILQSQREAVSAFLRVKLVLWMVEAFQAKPICDVG